MKSSFAKLTTATRSNYFVARLSAALVCAPLAATLMACNDGKENAAGVYGLSKVSVNGGAVGATGAARATDSKRMSRYQPEPLGANCMAGGTRIASGLETSASRVAAGDAEPATSMCALL